MWYKLTEKLCIPFFKVISKLFKYFGLNGGKIRLIYLFLTSSNVHCYVF